MFDEHLEGLVDCSVMIWCFDLLGICHVMDLDVQIMVCNVLCENTKLTRKVPEQQKEIKQQKGKLVNV